MPKLIKLIKNDKCGVGVCETCHTDNWSIVIVRYTKMSNITMLSLAYDFLQIVYEQRIIQLSKFYSFQRPILRKPAECHAYVNSIEYTTIYYNVVSNKAIKITLL